MYGPRSLSKLVSKSASHNLGTACVVRPDRQGAKALRWSRRVAIESIRAHSAQTFQLHQVFQTRRACGSPGSEPHERLRSVAVAGSDNQFGAPRNAGMTSRAKRSIPAAEGASRNQSRK